MHYPQRPGSMQPTLQGDPMIPARSGEVSLKIVGTKVPRVRPPRAR